MSYKLVCLLLALRSSAFCASSVFVPNSHNEVSSWQTRSSHILHKTERHNWLRQRISDEGRTGIKDHLRNKRGIVLIDEDFNVPPEPGVKQGWSDGGLGTETGTKNDKMATTEEGSGKSSELEELSTEKYTLKTSPSKLEMTSTGIKLTSAGEAIDIEGSGEETSEQSTPSSTEHPTETIFKPIPHSCLNSTCEQEIIILQGRTEIVPEGTNLTLTCVQTNTTKLGILQWYRYNESDSSLLQVSHQEQELSFDIPRSQVRHSGTYICIRSFRQSCCYRTLDIKVYKVPNYKYHLIIIGVVAAVSLFSCLLLGASRNFKAKKYEMELELQNMESECIYKM